MHLLTYTSSHTYTYTHISKPIRHSFVIFLGLKISIVQIHNDLCHMLIADIFIFVGDYDLTMSRT